MTEIHPQENMRVVRGYCDDEHADTMHVEQYDKTLLCFPKTELHVILPLEPKRREGRTYNAYYVRATADITTITPEQK
ncbi:MAG: hypothetical protein EAZ52_01050 [Alphaproteobacteria bacterium]|nr:MAG: hypothetical protein EAZ52_01050 [Alphaproteobacteria bacterium]